MKRYQSLNVFIHSRDIQSFNIFLKCFEENSILRRFYPSKRSTIFKNFFFMCVCAQSACFHVLSEAMFRFEKNVLKMKLCSCIIHENLRSRFKSENKWRFHFRRSVLSIFVLRKIKKVRLSSFPVFRHKFCHYINS